MTIICLTAVLNKMEPPTFYSELVVLKCWPKILIQWIWGEPMILHFQSASVGNSRAGGIKSHLTA